jgi:ABC-2 type transport system permease protein
MTNPAPTLRTSQQLAAIASLRWRLFVNSLRNRRGKAELVSRVIVSLAFTLGGLGGAIGMGGGAWYFVSQGKPEYLALLLWPVFFFWQVFPLMATAFTNNPDSSDLLRFPLSYRSYFLVRVAYGSLDPATALGSLWLSAILLGISVARPALFPWAALVLTAFAAFNILFLQMIFAWLERWLAQRRTREVMGVLFIFVILSFQLIGPLMEHFGGRSNPQMQHWIEIVKPLQQVLPAGLAADAIAKVAHSQFLMGIFSLGLLIALAAAMASLLHLRLRAQYRGENLSEAGASGKKEKIAGLRLGWKLPGVSSVISAVLEKEVRYLARSGPMLLTLIMPIFVLVVFRLGPLNPMRHSGFLMRAPDMAFPAAAGYTLLLLTNLVYNNFGGDAGGIQFFYAAPVSFRQIVLAKNLTHTGILLFDITAAWLAVTFLYGPPQADVMVASLAGLLFAAPLNFTIGNLLSLYSPKKIDFSTFGRQRASQLTVLASLGVQIVVMGSGAGIFILARHYGNMWIATLIFLLLAAISISAYAFTMQRMDGIAMQRRETLVAELCRA